MFDASDLRSYKQKLTIMKSRIAVFSLIFSAKLLLGQEIDADYKHLIKKADSLYKVKEYQNAALAYSFAFKSKGWKGTVKDRYNAALAWTMTQNPDSAFFNLDRIVDKLFFSNYDSIVKEVNFHPLHSDKRWLPLLDRIKKNILPKGCIRDGSNPNAYSMFIDGSAGQDGADVFSIKSKSVDTQTFGSGILMQNALPEEYLGKKIRMTGYMKSKNLEGWAGFYLRIDQPAPKSPDSFDNMVDRPIKGTTDWKKYEIVLYVPLKASNIAFGGRLYGNGQIWFSKVIMETVDKSVPTTGSNE